MEINGFKAFNSDMTNNYGFKFEEGMTYHIDGNISFGVRGNGFHMCKNIEDTFRYVDKNNVKVATVTGFGKIVESFDDYNGYYSMFATSDIRINHILSRKEIIDEILKKQEDAVCRFIVTGFDLSPYEINLFREKFSNSDMVNKYLDYYKIGNKKAFDISPFTKKLKR